MPHLSNDQRSRSYPSPLHSLQTSQSSTSLSRKQSSSSLSKSKHKFTTKDGYLDIDEDSLAHFATPVTEEDDPEEYLSLSAGIYSSPTESKGASFRDRVAKRWDKYAKQHHMHGTPPPTDYNNISTAQQVQMATTARSAMKVPVIVVEPTRGYAQEVLARNRGKRMRRTMSGHSWREPSIELFTVLETDESEGERKPESPKEERPTLRRKHDSGFMDGSWEEMGYEKPLVDWD